MGTVKSRKNAADTDLAGVPLAIVREAMADPVIGSRVILSSKRRVPLIHGSECVGFVTPHETKSGWRAGPIYVVPGHRGHHHVEEFYRREMREHPERSWVAFVPKGNTASASLHSRVGFVPWKRSKFGSWYRREATT